MSRAPQSLALVLLAACRPDFAELDSRISEPRVLAVRGSPAEGAPGGWQTFRALVALPGSDPPTWSFCGAPKSPTENNAVSAECLKPGSLTFIGSGTEVEIALPSDACARFGPDTPPGNFRPRDADITGGYYQPVRVDLVGQPPVFHLQRVRCALADATSDQASEFAAVYADNLNPTLIPLTARAAESGENMPLSRVPRGARIELASGWADGAAETYAYFDRSTQRVTTRREAMQIFWFVSAGQLEHESTGRTEGDSLTRTANQWTAPPRAGRSQVWLALRDSRGGVDFASYELETAP